MSNDTTRTRAPLLIDEPPIIVYPSLADAIGINEAIIFQQLHFLLNSTRQAKSKYNYVAGRWWVYNTYTEWREEHFTWLSEVTIRRIFVQLEEWQLIESRQSVRNKSDRTKWYTIDYSLWNDFAEAIVYFVELMRSKRSDEPCDQNDRIIGSIRSDGYTETPSEKKKLHRTKRDAKPSKTEEPKPRKRNPFFDAIVATFKYAEITDTEAKRIAKVANELKSAGYTPEDIAQIYAYCVRMAELQNWKTFTPFALPAHAANWKRSLSSAATESRDEVVITPTIERDSEDKAAVNEVLKTGRKAIFGGAKS